MTGSVILDVLGLIVNTFTGIYSALTSEILNGISVIEIMLGAGIIAFIGWVLVKWVIPT